MARRWRPSIAQVLFAAILAVSAATVGAVTLYWRHTAHDEALVAARQSLAAAAENVRLQADALVDPVVTMVGLLPHWAGDDIAPGPNGHALRDRFLAVLRDLPQVSDIFIGFDGGDYYRLTALHGHPAVRAAESDAAAEAEVAPEGAAYLERVILRDGRAQPLGIDRYLDADGTSLRARQLSDTAYDPRTRPWYAGALAGDHVYRSPIRPVAGSADPGVSFAHAFAGGVLGVDITLDDFGHFLDSLPQARTGVVALLDREAGLLARSATGLSAALLGDDAVARLADGLPAGTDGATWEVVLDDTAWLAHGALIAFGDESGEILLIALPRAVLTAEIERMTREAVLVTLLILLAATPLLWLVARSLSRPLKRLAVSADAIRRFELDGAAGSTSRIAEVERLEQAMADMRGSLRTFAVYVPKTLVKQLLEEASTPRLGGTRRDITVLFMDIENFTAMSADLEPEEVMRRMSRYFEVVTAILLAHDATIDKYIGDAVMAFWNAPADTAEHTRKACAAALEIAEAAERETRGWHRRGQPRLRTRIGIHRGEAIVGNVGSSDRMNYTALGATVNLAARLETLNRDRHTNILVSQAVVDRLRGDPESPFRFTPAGETTLRGFAEPVAVYALERPG